MDIVERFLEEQKQLHGSKDWWKLVNKAEDKFGPKVWSYNQFTDWLKDVISIKMKSNAYYEAVCVPFYSYDLDPRMWWGHSSNDEDNLDISDDGLRRYFELLVSHIIYGWSKNKYRYPAVVIISHGAEFEDIPQNVMGKLLDAFAVSNNVFRPVILVPTGGMDIIKLEDMDEKTMYVCY